MNKKIYLDNASNTPLLKELSENHIKYLNKIGNPSSNHSLGLIKKFKIEKARTKIARIFKIKQDEIIFTSSGTEANNLILRSSIKYLNIKCIITSFLEHKSVLETVYDLYKYYNIVVKFVKNNDKGEINLSDLKKKLKEDEMPTLVSLMYVNNEIGNILNIKKVGKLCKKYKNKYFHSDTIQAIGWLKINIHKLNLHFASCSAHKFYGPTGIGFAFVNKNLNIKSFLTGGRQEQNIRAGTENFSGIMGFTKALEFLKKDFIKHKTYLKKLKKYCIKELKRNIPDIKYVGMSESLKSSIYTIISIAIPKKELLTFKLDMKGIILSQSSACMSTEYSHVIKSLRIKNLIRKKTILRISLGIYNKKKEIIKFIKILKNIMEDEKS
ncbi:aminotransferase class V-fold PLP-dependent enzyme [Candidatus Karelsulcia muelleri]|uniref:cysteine desulfurase family protein n=1 Tax=Candidatus Karelsulcia muelleri TaxID=336810 RepID=UPI0023641963|nr:aminotransferase class V-fold PLP-dependent enzyme [Candidatus Karelsulcia muelleri]WDE42176.1 aminotransferase class V-fold PLP-dependent enzyme [Candidatus Karelsulcia muelleri]WDR79165.1 aminotransferase class V-fold PLP-dependent enzyme [Candidatus Karelsulcia muelleri]